VRGQNHRGFPLAINKISECHRANAYPQRCFKHGHGSLVQSLRGIHGGFVLARSPKDMTVYEIIQSVDPLARIKTCPLGLKAHGVNLWPSPSAADNAMAMVEQAFKDSTIADILAEPSTSKPLCSIP